MGSSKQVQKFWKLVQNFAELERNILCHLKQCFICNCWLLKTSSCKGTILGLVLQKF